MKKIPLIFAIGITIWSCKKESIAPEVYLTECWSHVPNLAFIENEKCTVEIVPNGFANGDVYLLKSNDNCYQPCNLPTEFRFNGKVISISGYLKNDTLLCNPLSITRIRE